MPSPTHVISQEKLLVIIEDIVFSAMCARWYRATVVINSPSKGSAPDVRMEARRAETRDAGLGSRQPSAQAARKNLCTSCLKLGEKRDKPRKSPLEGTSLEEYDDPVLNPTLTIEVVRYSVPAHNCFFGELIVRGHEIPARCRQRFIRASTGSTRLVDESYAQDGLKFLNE